MKNPWEEISLSDYENHMRLDSVMQLQAMDRLMEGQLTDYPVASAMILGVAGGNGLEHIGKSALRRVYGVDINAAYLEETARRYPELDGVLTLLRVDLLHEARLLPRAELVIANLLIEYIGYEAFQAALRAAAPRYVSCVIQRDTGARWVSDSPYLHAFDGLERVHRPIEAKALEEALGALGYRPLLTGEHGLPNGKKLVRLDFGR